MPLNRTELFNNVQPTTTLSLLPGLAAVITYMTTLRIHHAEEGSDISFARMPDGPVLVEQQNEGLVSLKMYHGRDTPEEEMGDWGFDGPTLTADIVVVFPDRVVLYHSGPMVATVIPLVENLLSHEGKFYGDFSIDCGAQP